MSRQRGLVLELEKGLAVVLTPDGQYRRIAAGRDWRLGQEIQFESTVVALPRHRRVSPAWLVAAVVLLALLVPGTLSLRSWLSQPALAAYVAVDINPSLELQVDADGKVLAAQAVNDDALQLLQELTLKGLPLEQAVRAITEKAVAAGYLSESNDNMLLITVTPRSAGAAVPQAVQEQVTASRQAATALLSQKGLKNDVEALTAPAEVRDVARRQGLPTGKLVVASEAARQGTMIDPKTLKSEPLTKAFEKAGGKDALQKALERIKEAKDKDALVQAVDDFVVEMSKGDGSDPGKGRDDGRDKEGQRSGPRDGEKPPHDGRAGDGGDKSGAGTDRKGSNDQRDGRQSDGTDGSKGDDRKDYKGSSGDHRLNPGTQTPKENSDKGNAGKNSKNRSSSQIRRDDAASGGGPGEAGWGEQFRELWHRLFGGTDASQTDGSTGATPAGDGQRD